MKLQTEVRAGQASDRLVGRRPLAGSHPFPPSRIDTAESSGS